MTDRTPTPEAVPLVDRPVLLNGDEVQHDESEHLLVVMEADGGRVVASGVQQWFGGALLRALTRGAAAEQEVARLRSALRTVTKRHDCPHGRTDVMHVAPFHFDGPACPLCSDAEYADRMQREEPCVICAALASDAGEAPRPHE